jgi:dipeptidyl aminopeptidase/acylaminoacyl peptidase
MGQSYEFFYAMKRAGKPVKLLLYENGGHSMKTPDAWDDAMLSTVAFFEDPKGFIENDYVEPEEPEKSGK